jgi:hypothetical protein
VRKTVAVKTINRRFTFTFTLIAISTRRTTTGPVETNRGGRRTGGLGVHISGLTGLRILLLGHVGFREKINRDSALSVRPAPLLSLSLEIFGRFSKRSMRMRSEY